MEKKMKELYSFSYLEKEKGKEDVSVRVILKKPNRREKEAIEEHFAVWLSKFINKGVLTKAGLIQHNETTGGVLSESNTKYISKLYADLAKVQSELTKMELEEKAKDETRERELNIELANLRKEIIEFESFHNSVFDNTAEVKARNKAIQYCVIEMTYKQKDGDKITPFFKGEEYEDKLDAFDEIDESGTEEEIKVINKLFGLWAFYYMGGSKLKDPMASFENVEKDIEKEEGEEKDSQNETGVEAKKPNESKPSEQSG